MNMARALLFVLLVLPVLEIYVLMKLIGAFGFLPTLALLLGAAALGMQLLRSQGWQVGRRIQETLARGEPPTLAVLDGGLLALGGVLLLIPGFLSDLLALVCLIPVTRRRLAAYLSRQLVPPHAADSGDRLTIEGEFRREK